MFQQKHQNNNTVWPCRNENLPVSTSCSPTQLDKSNQIESGMDWRPDVYKFLLHTYNRPSNIELGLVNIETYFEDIFFRSGQNSQSITWTGWYEETSSLLLATLEFLFDFSLSRASYWFCSIERKLRIKFVDQINPGMSTSNYLVFVERV